MREPRAFLSHPPKKQAVSQLGEIGNGGVTWLLQANFKKIKLRSP